jgi:hypothetical protein
VFDEAERRDPTHQRTWIALVDGNNHQIDQIAAQANARGIGLTIIVDFIHVLEYVWKAAWCFHPEGDPAAEQWVADKAREILSGNAGLVAAAIRRTATRRDLTAGQRAGADAAADYLHNKKRYLDYPTALHAGWPIATGVIEGACRHLVKDRNGYHRRPLGPGRRRSHPQAARPGQQRRLRHLLGLPPTTGTPTRPQPALLERNNSYVDSHSRRDAPLFLSTIA